MHSKRSNCSVSLHSGEYTVSLFIFTSSSFVFVYISCLCFCDVLCFIQTPAQWKYVLGAVFLRTKKNMYPGLRLLAVYTNPLEGVVQIFFDNLKYVTGACFIYVSFLVSPLFTFFRRFQIYTGARFSCVPFLENPPEGALYIFLIFFKCVTRTRCLVRAISRNSTRGRCVAFFAVKCYTGARFLICHYS